MTRIGDKNTPEVTATKGEIFVLSPDRRPTTVRFYSYTPLFKTVYGDSQIQKNSPGRKYFLLGENIFSWDKSSS